MPAIDVALGFDAVAKHYYFPGWHQQSTIVELIINLEKWNGLADLQRAWIEAACGDNVQHTLAEGEAIQHAALADLSARGVQIHRWPGPHAGGVQGGVGRGRRRGRRGRRGLPAGAAVAAGVP